MFKKLIFFVLFYLPFVVWSAESQTKQDELKAIENEIQELKKQWHQINLQEMKDEVEGQAYMIGNWEAYRRKLEEIRAQEKVDDQIELRIKKLEERKAQLLEQAKKVH